MGREYAEEVRRLRAVEDHLRQENEQLHAEIEHLVEMRRTTEDGMARYAELYDHAPLPLLTIDGAGLLRALNVNATTLLAGPNYRASLVGLPLRRFVFDADRGVLTEHLRRCHSAATPVSCELRLLRAEGEPPLLISLWSTRPRPDARSYPSAMVDLTETRRNALEIERLVEAERTARVASDAKDQFIAILSHELRAPLTPVLAAASSLAQRSDLDPEVRTTSETIIRNVQIEARLIDDLLDVNRIVRGKMLLHRELVDVHQLATEALEMIRDEARGKGITLIEGLEARRHWAFGDAIRVRQVLWNLLRNAVKFTPQDGQIALRSWDRDGHLAIEVSDSGVGFAPEAAPRLFQAFEQEEDLPRPYGGLGLSLAICKGIIELHGGTITGTSTGRDEGARFVVELDAIAPSRGQSEPLPHEPQRPSTRDLSAANTNGAPVRPTVRPQPVMLAAQSPGPNGASTPRTAIRILLVEDDTDTGNMLRDLLTDAGYEVRCVRSARDALAERLDGVDLVLSDIGLPDASGLDLMRALRGQRRIKGIALSGYGTEADIQASRDAGFEIHLTKPIEVNGLLDIIDRVVAAP